MRKKAGRKPLYRASMIEEAYKLGALGLTIEEIADFWHVTRQSLHRWAVKHPELSYTIKKGRAEADATVIQALLKKAKEGDITGCIFWLKNRHPDKWRDRYDHKHTGKVEQVHFFEQLLIRKDEAKAFSKNRVKGLLHG